MISQEVGYDAGKQIHGRKRHLTVDLLGLVLRVLVTSASLPERQGAKLVLKRVHDRNFNTFVCFAPDISTQIPPQQMAFILEEDN